MLMYRTAALPFLAAAVLGVGICSCDSASQDKSAAASQGKDSGSVPDQPGSDASSDGPTDGKADAALGISDQGLIPQGTVFRSTTEWYREIDTAPVAEHSNEMIAALTRWGTSGAFKVDFSFSVLDGTGAAPAAFPQNDEADDIAVPIPAKGYVEGDYAYGACPVPNEDCHLIVLDRSANKLFEVYQARKNGSTWEGFVTLWQLDKAYPRSNRGQGCTSADAAGIAIVPGLIGYRETKAGAIRHALRFIIRNDFIRGVAGDKTVPNNVYPASHGSFAGNARAGIPYGGRLRLKAQVSENDPRFRSSGAKAIVVALRRYGMILADGGNIPLVAESDRVYKDADPSQTWDGTLAANDLVGILPSDFEVIGIPKDRPGGSPGFYSAKAEYEAQFRKPLGCMGIVQP
jgi:hypothetical protein